MARGILMEQFHITVSAPRGLRAEEYDAIRRALDGRAFRAALRRAARAAARRHPPLDRVRVTVTR